MFKKSILIVVILVILMFMTLLFLSFYQSKNIRREPRALMSKYYRLKITNPIAAQQALLILVNQDNAYPPAIREARLWYSHNQNFEKALRKSMRLEDSLSHQHKAFIQLACLEVKKQHLASVIVSPDPTEPRPFWRGIPLANARGSDSSGETMTEAQHLGLASLLPSYPVMLKRIDTPKPKPIVHAIGSKNLAEAMANRGFLAIKQHRPYVAIDYFKEAYALTHQPSLAMQLGYLYDQVDDKPAAYKAFTWATRSSDPALALHAENAKTNLAGLQTKAFPVPYFSEVFFNPLTQSRFGLTVRPLVVRLGVEQNNTLHTKQYLVFRRTDDNKSENLGQISQIYEDNVQITGVGGQITPFNGFPLIGFLEAGAAYDLVYRNRDRWRGDLRTGFMYYDEFCARPAYFDKLTLSTHYYSDIYGDVTYFTRYRNVIGGVKTHQGIRLLQYHSSMVNLYATGRMIEDTQRLFFNNFAEIGPGIEFIPTNRLNIRLRFEHVNGVYLPAGVMPNPYSKYYINNLVQLLFYVKV